MEEKKISCCQWESNPEFYSLWLCYYTDFAVMAPRLGMWWVINYNSTVLYTLPQLSVLQNAVLSHILTEDNLATFN
jgi:hypothetical protein